MLIALHQRDDKGVWKKIKAGPPNSTIWDAADRNWIDQLYITKGDYVQSGNIMYCWIYTR